MVVSTNKLKGRTDCGWLASLFNALRTMGDNMSTGTWGEYLASSGLGLSLPVFFFFFFKGSGVKVNLVTTAPWWDLTDTILNVNPLRKGGNGRHHSAFLSLFLSPESREKSPFMYIYMPCTCTLLFIYWRIFSVYSCTVIFCRDLVYRAYRRMGVMEKKKRVFRLTKWRKRRR